jgi:hypothetical protein
MVSPKQPERRSRGDLYLILFGVLVVLLMFGALFWGRENITWIKQQRGGNAWYLTYEGASVSGDPRATAVSYVHNPDRFKPDRSTERLGATGLPWSKEVSVNTGQEAHVEVTPAGKGVARCRILLDGVRVVAEGTSPGPGKPAVCRVTTSSTPEKWPR